jgi:hypothetical protein
MGEGEYESRRIFVVELRTWRSGDPSRPNAPLAHAGRPSAADALLPPPAPLDRAPPKDDGPSIDGAPAPAPFPKEMEVLMLSLPLPELA